VDKRRAQAREAACRMTVEAAPVMAKSVSPADCFFEWDDAKKAVVAMRLGQ